MTRTESEQRRAGKKAREYSTHDHNSRRAAGPRDRRPNRRQKNQFLDPFWVRRKFQMPGIASDQRVWLRLGGVLPAAAVYLNGAYVGYTKSSRTQQRVDVTKFVKPGAENLVAIKVCDFPKVRLDGMYEWQELSMIWSGVYRPVGLEITDTVSLIDRIHPTPTDAVKDGSEFCLVASFAVATPGGAEGDRRQTVAGECRSHTASRVRPRAPRR